MNKWIMHPSNEKYNAYHIKIEELVEPYQEFAWLFAQVIGCMGNNLTGDKVCFSCHIFSLYKEVRFNWF